MIRLLLVKLIIRLWQTEIWLFSPPPLKWASSVIAKISLTATETFYKLKDSGNVATLLGTGPLIKITPKTVSVLSGLVIKPLQKVHHFVFPEKRYWIYTHYNIFVMCVISKIRESSFVSINKTTKKLDDRTPLMETIQGIAPGDHLHACTLCALFLALAFL